MYIEYSEPAAPVPNPPGGRPPIPTENDAENGPHAARSASQSNSRDQGRKGHRGRKTRRRRLRIDDRIRAAIGCGLNADGDENLFTATQALLDEQIPDNSLKWAIERNVLVEVSTYAGRDGLAYPSIGRLHKTLGYSEKSIGRALACLRARGILILVRQGGQRNSERMRGIAAAAGEDIPTWSGPSVYKLNVAMIDRFAGYEAPERDYRPPDSESDTESGYSNPTVLLPTTVVGQDEPERESNGSKDPVSDEQPPKQTAPVVPPPPPNENRAVTAFGRPIYSLAGAKRAAERAGLCREGRNLWWRYVKQPDPGNLRRWGVDAGKYSIWTRKEFADATLEDDFRQWKDVWPKIKKHLESPKNTDFDPFWINAEAVDILIENGVLSETTPGVSRGDPYFVNGPKLYAQADEIAGIKLSKFKLDENDADRRIRRDRGGPETSLIDTLTAAAGGSA